MVLIKSLFFIALLSSIAFLIPLSEDGEVKYTVFEEEKTSIIYQISSRSVQIILQPNNQIYLNLSFFESTGNKIIPFKTNLLLNKSTIIEVKQQGYYMIDIISSLNSIVILKNKGLNPSGVLLFSILLIINITINLKNYIRNLITNLLNIE